MSEESARRQRTATSFRQHAEQSREHAIWWRSLGEDHERRAMAARSQQASCIAHAEECERWAREIEVPS